ncbi:MAG: RNA polymerase sigma factor [Bacteroidota bacterium]
MDHLTERFLRSIEEYKSIITSLCYAYYHSAEDIKDVRQEIVLQLWKSFETFKGESKISTWIYRVSLNTILSRRRKEKKQLENELVSLSDVGEKQLFFHDDDDQLFQYVLNKLKKEDKAIFILQLEGYQIKEIASILGLSITNISTRLYRMKSFLRKNLNIKTHGSTTI